jgi:hypothetical protein
MYQGFTLTRAGVRRRIVLTVPVGPVADLAR